MITITQKELDEIVFKEIQKKRRILFDLCMEEYSADITYKEKKFLWKKFVVLDKRNWNKLWRQFCRISNDLMDAREILEITEPFYKQYHVYHEQKQENQFSSFDEYMGLITTEYSSAEFEKVRDKFEEYCKQLDSEPER